MPIDWSPLNAPVQPSPIAQGIRGIGSALDAVLARRQAMENARLQREAAAERASMVDSREWARINTNDANADASREQRGELADRNADLRERSIANQEDYYDSRLQQDADARETSGDAAGAAAIKKLIQDRRVARAGRVAPVQPTPAQSTGAAPPAPAAATAPAPETVTPESVTPAPVTMPDPAPAAPAPAPDVPGAVANRTARNPVDAARAWGNRQLQLYGSDPDYATAIKSIVASAEGRVTDPEKLQAALERAFANINTMRDRRLREGERKDRKEETDERRRGQIETDWDLKVDRVLKNLQFRKLVDKELSDQDLSIIAKGAPTSAPMATLLRGRWAKFGQGAGVLTDHDLNTFYNNMGGIAARYGKRLEEFLYGTVPEDAVADIVAALKQLRDSTTAQTNEIGKRLTDYMADPTLPGGVERIPRYLRAYAPGYLPIWEAKQEARRAAGELRRELGTPNAQPAGAP